MKWDDGVRIKFGSITGEMLYDAAEAGDPVFLEEVRQGGGIFGVHLTIPFG